MSSWNLQALRKELAFCGAQGLLCFCGGNWLFLFDSLDLERDSAHVPVGDLASCVIYFISAAFLPLLVPLGLWLVSEDPVITHKHHVSEALLTGRYLQTSRL